MSKQDLREYSEQELSLLIFNDEYFYKMRRRILRNPSLLSEFFEYTEEQLEIALKDINDDLNEVQS